MYRSTRMQSGVPTIALVGYTNAGKSALLSNITKKETVVKNQLFSTLDPLSRRFQLPDRQLAILTDTVGFIQKLPTALVAAFRATLEELHDAALILHVADVSNKLAESHISMVNDLLGELGLKDKPTIVVLNKLDLVTDRRDDLRRLLLTNLDNQNTVLVSAKTGEGVNHLLELLQDKIHPI